jgi:hypothetical protein
VLVLALAVAGLLAGAGGARAQSAWWTPPAHPTWYWQLTGKIDNAEPVEIYDIDGFENSAAEVAALHAQGKHVVCYIDVGTAEDFRPDYRQFPKSVLGRPNGWPGERWLDIRQLSVLEPIMTARFRMCQEKGFDAVEPDNMEGYSNNSGGAQALLRGRRSSRDHGRALQPGAQRQALRTLLLETKVTRSRAARGTFPFRP